DIRVGILFEQGALQAAEGFSLAAKALLAGQHQSFLQQAYLVIFLWLSSRRDNASLRSVSGSLVERSAVISMQGIMRFPAWIFI
ncbi:hypothetical protein, partial [Salmonella enterica]|uniref:hypothetical protein n=1 Tax=Salmonella enterica TaxID=28901 RepID=UPI0013E92C4A